MGQYYKVVNLDRREYLDPHKFGDGLKLMEFGNSGQGTLTALAVLLADGNGRGGGDLQSEDPIVGSWAGDRIVIAGDYADGGKFMPDVSEEELQSAADESFSEGYRDAEKVNLYMLARESFRDISDDVIQVIAKAEAGYGHRLSKLDLSEDGWRTA